MTTPYSQTTWTVKPGSEDEFVRRWVELAEWSEGHGLGEHTMLFRDVEQPSRFISFGPWDSLESIRLWRGTPGFHERVARLREVLDGFDPHTLEMVSEQGHHHWPWSR